jgi:hydrogenase-1 operon protein HyaE
MFTPLLASIIDRHGYRVVTDADLDAAARPHHHVMLLLAGDADRLAESNDLAVIVPELERALNGRITVLVAARDSERALQRRFRFAAFPALVFLRGGEYLGAISRVRDWADYRRDIPEILARAPSDPPPFKLPGGTGRATLGGDAPEHDHDSHDHHH